MCYGVMNEAIIRESIMKMKRFVAMVGIVTMMAVGAGCANNQAKETVENRETTESYETTESQKAVENAKLA